MLMTKVVAETKIAEKFAASVKSGNFSQKIDITMELEKLELERQIQRQL